MGAKDNPAARVFGAERDAPDLGAHSPNVYRSPKVPQARPVSDTDREPVLGPVFRSVDSHDIFPYTDHMKKRTAFAKLIARTAPHLSQERQAELTELFTAATDPHKPLLWAMKPESESFETFIRREYLDRGIIGSGVTASDVGRYDEKFEKVYRSQLALGRVPKDCQFAKAGKVPIEKRRELSERLLG
jgi:hypothetical protein